MVRVRVRLHLVRVVNESALVCYSVSHAGGQPSSTRLWQLLTSIRTLRQHNSEIPVVVFLYGTPAADFTASLVRLGVHVRQMGTYRSLIDRHHSHGDVLEQARTLHRFLDLDALTEWEPERVLCLDADTVILGDVAELFERYREGDCYAREEQLTRRSRSGYRPDIMVDEDALAELVAQEGTAPIPPFNAGVLLLSQRVWIELAQLESIYFDYAWRFLTWMALNPQDVESTGYREGAGVDVLRARVANGIVADSLERALPFPSSNRWLIGETTLWMTLGHIPGLTYFDFSPAHVRQGEETFTDGGLTTRAQSQELVVSHYFYGQTQKVRWHMTTEELIRELDQPVRAKGKMLQIPDEVLRSPLVTEGSGLAVYEDLLDPDLMWALQTESMSAYWAATPEEQWIDDLGEGRGAHPRMRFMKASGGPAQTTFYQSDWLSAFLSRESGMEVVPAGSSGGYSYYTREGDFLGLHLDVDYCDMVLLTVLNDNSEADDPSGALVVYRDHIGGPLAPIRQDLESGATYLKLRSGQSIVMLGGILPHRVAPVRREQSRVLSVLCFTAKPTQY